MRIKVLCFYAPYMMQDTSQQEIIDQTEFNDAVRQTYGSLLSNIGREDNLPTTETINEYRLVVPSSSAFKSPGVQALSFIQGKLDGQFISDSPKLTVQELELNKHNLFQYLYFVAHSNSVQNPYSKIEMDFYYPQEKADEVQATIDALQEVVPFNVKIDFKKFSATDCSLTHSVKGTGFIDSHFEANVHEEPSELQSKIIESLGSVKENHLKFHIELILRLNKLNKILEGHQLNNPFKGYIKTMNDLIRIQVIAQKDLGWQLLIKAQELLNESLRYMSNPDITTGVSQLLNSVFEMIKDLDERNPNYKLNSLDSSHQQESAVDLLISATVIVEQFCNHLRAPDPTNLDIIKHESDYLARSNRGKEVAGKALKAAGIFSITLPIFAFIALPLMISPTFTLPLALIAAGLYAAFTIATVFAGALLGHMGNNKIAQAKVEQSVKENFTANASTFFRAIDPSPRIITANDTDPVLLVDYSVKS